MYNLLLKLPRNSLFQDAVAQDDELADMMVRDEDEEGSKAISLSMFSPEVEAIYNVVDRLGSVISAVVAGAGGKPKPVRPLPRPKTAIERARARKDLERHKALVARVLPNG